MEQFFGALKELIQGCDFGSKEESIVRDVFILNMRNEEIRKQFCIETLVPSNALRFVVVKDRCEIM